MKRHALVIGSQTFGLAGVLRDAERVAHALGERGFDVLLRVEGDATRDGILQGYRELIHRCAPGDAVFIYYSGHGAWARAPGEGLQCIVPVDYAHTTAGDFRGICAPELSGLLGELTSRTRNVALVFDCCFSAGLSRGPHLRPRALPEVPLEVVRAHLERLRGQGVPLGGPHVESNPDAVRLMAAAADELAYEGTDARGLTTGLLTDAFLTTLREADGHSVTWGQLARRVRELVLARGLTQRPELEGPGRRLLFRLDELARDSTLAYHPAHGGHWLRGGRLHGVGPGDEYLVMPLGAHGPDTATALARARVTSVQAGASRADLMDRKNWDPLPKGAPAFLVSVRQPRGAVALEGPWPEHPALQASLRAALEASPFVQPATGDAAEPVLARVRPGPRGVAVLDPGEAEIVHPLPPATEHVPEVLGVLERLAVARTLRALDGGGEGERLEDGPEVGWGRVVRGREEPLPPTGAVLHVGERLFVAVRNPGLRRCYVSVLDVGVGGHITLLSTSQPSGMSLEPGARRVLGARHDGTLAGLALEWPASVPREGARLEQLVVIASDAPVDLRALETGDGGAGRSTASVLERLLQRLRTGATRALASSGAGAAPVRYAVRHLRFWLEPRPHPPS